MVHVKICGIRTLADALAAVDAGADMLGFNFYTPSPRSITPEACAEIVAYLKRRGSAVTQVGVFVNASANDILSTLQTADLDYAQLSGDEDGKIFARVQHIAFKAIRPTTLAEARTLAARYANPKREPALLLDAYHPKLFGGTGRTASPEIARSIAAVYPTLLAGGLQPGSVAEAIRLVRPWGVDVASGVESAPGVKDPEKIATFIRLAKAAGA